MDSRDLVMAAVAASPGGTISGRTILQKVGYFCSVLLRADYGFDAHFYGPYSSEIADSLSTLVGLGFFEENTGSINQCMQRYTYSLTKDGAIVNDDLRERDAEYKETCSIVKRITEIPGWNNTQTISCAAKVYFILAKHNKPMTFHAIRTEASNLHWELTEEAINNVVGFLRELDLLETDS